MKRLLVATAVASLFTFTPVARAHDAYDDSEANPLRMVAYALYPVGWAAEWLQTYLKDHLRARTGELHKAAEPAGFPERTVDRALKHLKRLGTIRQPSRGWWISTQDSAQQEAGL